MLPQSNPDEQDTTRSDAVWELLGDHLVELVRSRRKLRALATYKNRLERLIGAGYESGDLADVVLCLSNILDEEQP